MSHDHYDQKQVAVVSVDGVSIEVVGYSLDDAPDGQFEWFDLFDCATGECLNEGDYLYEQPDAETVATYVRERNAA